LKNLHDTRHPARLDRDFGSKRFGDASYAMEELVAEIGAAFLCADLGITPETREEQTWPTPPLRWWGVKPTHLHGP
jgi:antirestriction protein ArdC